MAGKPSFLHGGNRLAEAGIGLAGIGGSWLARIGAREAGGSGGWGFGRLGHGARGSASCGSKLRESVGSG